MWIMSENVGRETFSTITSLNKFPPNNAECQPRYRIYCDSLTMFTTTHDLLLPVIPGRLVYLRPQEGITVWVCADLLGHTEEHWSQAACSSSPERL